jgi:phage terminase large subunit GpA-like protein
MINPKEGITLHPDGTVTRFTYDESEPKPKHRMLADMKCPQCAKEFRLKWEDYDGTRASLLMRSCPSGGIYDVSIACPHCDYAEEL